MLTALFNEGKKEFGSPRWLNSFQKYFRGELITSSNWQHSDKFVICGTFFCFNDFFEGKQNSRKHQKALEKFFLQFGSFRRRRHVVEFSTRYTYILKSHSTKGGIFQNKIRILNWPALDPVLALIENLWVFYPNKFIQSTH